MPPLCPLHALPLLLLCPSCPIRPLFCRHPDCALRHSHPDSSPIQLDLISERLTRYSHQLKNQATAAVDAVGYFFNKLRTQLFAELNSVQDYQKRVVLSAIFGNYRACKKTAQQIQKGQFQELDAQSVIGLDLHLRDGIEGKQLLLTKQRAIRKLNLRIQNFEQLLDQLLKSKEFQALAQIEVRQNNRVLPGSTILSIAEERVSLKTIGLSMGYMDLVFKASSNAFSSKSFHQVCDGMPFTLSLVENDKGRKYGGFAVPPWRSDCSFMEDPTCSSFVFDLSDKTRQELRADKLKKGLYGFVDEGPNFVDWGVVDCCNESSSNWGVLGGQAYGQALETLTFFRVKDY